MLHFISRVLIILFNPNQYSRPVILSNFKDILLLTKIFPTTKSFGALEIKS